MREGAGRPKGSLAKRTKMLRDIRDKAIAAGITPLEVMLKNMRYYDDKAEVAADILAQALAKKDDTTAAMIRKLEDLCNFRKEATACAALAAPYCHPHVSPIVINDQSTTVVMVNRVERYVITDAPISHVENRDVPGISSVN